MTQELKEVEALQLRAQKLAEALILNEDIGNQLRLVEFHLGNERYAIEVQYIKEVYPLKDFFPLPGCANYILGIMNVRGRIISIVDIRKFFNLPIKRLSELDRVIILSHEGVELAVFAEMVLGKTRVDRNKLQTNLFTNTGIQQEYLKGIVDENLIVLDAEKLIMNTRVGL